MFGVGKVFICIWECVSGIQMHVIGIWEYVFGIPVFGTWWYVFSIWECVFYNQWVFDICNSVKCLVCVKCGLCLK